MIRKTVVNLFRWYIRYGVVGVTIATCSLVAVTELSSSLIFEPTAATMFLSLFFGLIAIHFYIVTRWLRPVFKYEEEEDGRPLTADEARHLISCLNKLVIESTLWIQCAWPLGGIATAVIFSTRKGYTIGILEKSLIIFVSSAVGLMISIYQRALTEHQLEPIFQFFRAKGGLQSDDPVFHRRIQSMRWSIGWPVACLIFILIGFGIIFGFAQGEKTVRSTMERMAAFRLSGWYQALESTPGDPSENPDNVQMMGTQMALFKPSPHGAVIWFNAKGKAVGDEAESAIQLEHTPLAPSELDRLLNPDLASKNTHRTLELEADTTESGSPGGAGTGGGDTARQIDYRRMLSHRLDLWVWMPLTHGGAIAMVFPREDIQQEQKTVIAVSAIFLVVGLLLWRLIIFTAESVTQPLSKLSTSLAGIAEGDLSKQVNVAAYNEVGLVSRAVQLMSEGLRALVGRIGQSSTQLGEISSRVSRSSGEVQQSTQEQVKAVEVASASIEQIGRSLGEVSRTVSGLSDEARAANLEVEEVKRGSIGVETAVDSLSNKIEETNSSIFQVAASIRSVVGNVDALSMTANDTAASIREMEQSITSVRDLANDSVETAGRVLQDAELGAKAVQDNLQTMEAIRENSMQATTTMQQLSASLGEIREIVQVIQDVASKTNLLSLNAAIIAAQAGDEGAGFSVVATQIKQLSGRTQRSARDIGERIQAILKEAESAVQLVLQGDQQIGRGVNVSAEARAALEQIQFSTVEISERIKRIARATDEQTKGAADITQSIGRTVEMIDSIARATDEQSKGAEQITKASESMQQTASSVLETTTDQKKLTSRIAERISRIAQLVETIDRAAREQGAGAKEISWAATSISESSRHNLDRVLELNEVIQLLAAEAKTLATTVQNFKV